MPKRTPVLMDETELFASTRDAARALFPGAEQKVITSRAAVIGRAARDRLHTAYGHTWHLGEMPVRHVPELEARIGALEAALRVTRERLQKANDELRRAGLGEV